MKKPHVKISGAFTHYDKILPMLVKYRSVIDFAVYDGIRECDWNGGRVNRNLYDTPKQKATLDALGVGIALAFSNPTIDLSDPVGNELLEHYHSEKNSVILQNPELLAYIREKFPKYECIFTITGHPAVIDDPVAYYAALEMEYDVIVPKLEHNMIIETFTPNVEKYELLINDDCLYNCPLWKKHFDAISGQNTKRIRFLDNKKANMKIEECWLSRKVFDPDIGDTKAREEHGFLFGMSLEEDQIRDRINKGIFRLKISGREMGTEEFQRHFARFVDVIKSATK